MAGFPSIPGVTPPSVSPTANSPSSNQLKDSDPGWCKNPLAIRVIAPHKSILDSLIYSTEYDFKNASGEEKAAMTRILNANAQLFHGTGDFNGAQNNTGFLPEVDKAIAAAIIASGETPLNAKNFDNNKIFREFNSSLEEDPTQQVRGAAIGAAKGRGFFDTSIGGNLTFNPLWQFGPDDDIVHPMNRTGDDSDPLRGLGRVYSEMYQSTQRILWMRFGVPKYKGLKDFYLSTEDGTTLSKYVNTGTWSFSGKMAHMLATGGRLAFEMPFLPLMWASDIMSGLQDTTINKYYDLHPTMTMYFQVVNVMLSQLAVNFGFYRVASSINPLSGGVDASGNKVDTYLTQLKDVGMPDVLKRGGPDIFAIMDKRASRLEGREPRRITYLTDCFKPKGDTQEPKGFLDFAKNLGIDFAGSVRSTAFDSKDWVGFRIEKGSDSSESVSNSTGQSEVAAALNAQSAKAKERVFSASGFNTGIEIIDGSLEAAGDVLKGIASALGGGKAVDIVTGNGYFDLPEVWKGSTFSKSYSFDIQLRAKYGDPVTIFQSVYIPLVMILAAALPRGIGSNQYTSPFILEAYADGMFAIPAGIIESVTIKRGLAEHGWSVDGLPTSVDISINIKDLSPSFFLSMADLDGGFSNAFKSNSTMQQYLSTLSGLGVADRTFRKRQILSKLDAALLVKRNTTFSPIFQGNKVGDWGIVRTVATVLPGWTTPNNN